jgi:purine-binding chemotaxis protein CheW
MLKLATFWIDNDLFGVNILLAREISVIHDITPIAKSPDYIMGLMNLRGQIITVIDPSYFLHNRGRDCEKNSRLLIFKGNEEIKSLIRMQLVPSDVCLGTDPLALKIDRIDNVVDVDEDDILPPPSTLTGVDRELVTGVIEKFNNLVIVLNMNKFVAKILEAQE